MLLSPSLYCRDGLHQGAHWGSFLAVRRCHQIQLIWWGRPFPFPEVISCTGELQATRCTPGLFSRSDGPTEILTCCLWRWIHLYLPLQPVNEHCISIAGLVFSPQRARLDSCNFENQLLLKIDSKCVDFKEESRGRGDGWRAEHEGGKEWSSERE